MKQVIFTLTSARSGTVYLRGLFQRNIPGCDCRHEPFFDWGNPTMLGPAIYDAYAGRIEKLRARMARKLEYVNRLSGRAYLESSHAFLKSAYLVALEFFPDLELIHLIRDPLKVSKSEAYREAWRQRVRAPFHYYRGDDGRRHFCWALTANEPIFRHFELSRLSLFQRYLVQWIEIENRAMAFLQANQLQSRCFTVRAPRDLNDPAVVASMFDFFGLKPAGDRVIMGGRRNKSLGRTTVITPRDEQEAAAVLERLPAQYLEIFRREPDSSEPWSWSLVRTRAGGTGGMQDSATAPAGGLGELSQARLTSASFQEK